MSALSSFLSMFGKAASSSSELTLNPRSEKSSLMAGPPLLSRAGLLHQTVCTQTEEQPAVSEAAVLRHAVHTDDLTCSCRSSKTIVSYVQGCRQIMMTHSSLGTQRKQFASFLSNQKDLKAQVCFFWCCNMKRCSILSCTYMVICEYFSIMLRSITKPILLKKGPHQNKSTLAYWSFSW